MHQLATTIQENINLLVDRYEASLCTVPGYDRMTEAMRRQLERHVLDLIAQCLENADHTALIQYVQERAIQWEAQGLNLTWFQRALQVPQAILTPLIDSVETGNFLWQALNNSQGVVWQRVADYAHQAEERFRSIIETSHSGVLITDDAFHLTYVNDELVQISGYTREELLGADFRHLLDEESQRIVADYYVRRQHGEDTPPRYEVAFLRKDGAKRYIEMSAVSLKDLNGKPYTVAQVLDVSERRQTEQALRASEEQYRNAIAAADAVPYYIDYETENYRFIGEGIENFTGYSPQEVTPDLLGRMIQETIMTGTGSGLPRAAAIQKTRAGEVPQWNADYRLIDRHGATRWLSDSSVQVLDDQSKPIGAVGILQDITARKQAETELVRNAEKQQALTQRLRATIEATDELMRAPDLDTLYRRAVELAREKLGVERCGLFIVDPTQQFMLGTYGTDEQGRTTDEHAARDPIEIHQTMSLSHEQIWVVQEAPQALLKAGKQQTIGTGWVGGTAIRSASGPIGVLYNDAAISQAPPDRNLQESLGIYCSMLGNIIERKRLELQIRESLDRRSVQVQTSVEVAQHVAAAPEIGELFHRVVTLVKERFNYYHAQLFRYVPDEDAVELITGYGEIGQKMLAVGHKLAMGRGVVGTAAATGQSILAADVARDLDWRPNPNLPDTKGELAVPIKLGSGDAESQAHALKHFTTGGYDGIAVAAIDPETIARITHESHRHGKPVVAITTDLGPDNQTALVFAVEHELGYLLGVQAGTWAKQYLPGSQSVHLGMLTYRTLPNVVQRERGIIDGIQSVIGERVTIVASESALESKEAAYLAEGWLRAYPDLNMILAYNDATALGAYQAAQNAGRHDPDQFFIGGIDGVPEALDAIQQGGVYQATVNQPPEVMGIMAVRTLIAAIKGIPVKPTCALYCAPVNRSNAAEFSGLSRESAVLANQDVIPAEALSGFDVSGLRLGLSVLTLANPFFATLAESAQKEARRLGVQLVVNDPSQVLGVLDVQSDQANTLTDDDRLLLEGLCGQIASAMESTRLLEELRRGEAELSQTLKIAKLAYWEYDVEKDQFLFNDQFYSIFHTTAEQAGGYRLSSAQYAQKFVYPDDLPVVGIEIEKALHSSERHYSRQLEHRIQYADGGVGYISVSINIDRDEQGHILRYYGANQDITERKQIEEALAQEQSLMHVLMDTVTDHIYFKDLQSRFLRISKSQADRFGLSDPALAVGKTDFDYFTEEHARPAYEDEQEIIRTGQPITKEERETWQDQSDTWVSTTKFPLRDETRNIVGTFGISHDMTERKLAETERERLLADQQKRTLQLQTASEVSRAASSILKLDELLPQTAELICARFNLYYVGIFLLDEAERWAILRAGTGEAGHNMLASDYKLRISGNSLISQCVTTQQARIALDVGEEVVRFDNPLLPLTRSEMALPLISRGRVIGAMTIQSDQPAAFSADDTTVLQSMADQISNAVENARLYERAQAALQEVDAINRRLTGEAWNTYLHQQAGREVIWLADDEAAAPQVLPEINEQLTAGEVTLEPDPEDGSEATVTAPILLRGQPIGALRLRTPVNEWSEDTEVMLADIASHVAQAVENARLVEQTQRTASRERTINEINARVRQSVDLDAILRTAVNELGQSLKAARVVARVGTTAAEDDGRGKTND